MSERSGCLFAEFSYFSYGLQIILCNLLVTNRCSPRVGYSVCCIPGILYALGILRPGMTNITRFRFGNRGPQSVPYKTHPCKGFTEALLCCGLVKSGVLCFLR